MFNNLPIVVIVLFLMNRIQEQKMCHFEHYYAVMYFDGQERYFEDLPKVHLKKEQNNYLIINLFLLFNLKRVIVINKHHFKWVM